MIAIVRAACTSALATAAALSPENREPTRSSWAAMPSGPRGPEAGLGEPQPIRSRVAGRLGQARRDQGQVHPDPVQGHQAERDLDGVVLARQLGCERGRGVGHLRDSAQQAQLVGRGLVIVQDDAPQQGQRPRAIVRQPEAERCPGHVGAAKGIGLLERADHHQPVLACQCFDLPGRGRPHRPVGLRRTPAQAHQLAEGTRPGRRQHVHPDGAEQHKVERQSEAVDSREIGQTIIDPTD
jgi:hypothetical protein